MEINTNNQSLAENKVLILYILDKINKSIPSDGLYKILSAINDINYFYFKQYLVDLVETKFVGTYEKDKRKLYEITNEGREALELTKELLPGIIKLKADHTFKEELSSFEESTSISSEYIPINEKNFTVKCKITENNSTIFEITVATGSRDEAKLISDNWNKNASTIYPEILKLLKK